MPRCLSALPLQSVKQSARNAAAVIAVRRIFQKMFAPESLMGQMRGLWSPILVAAKTLHTNSHRGVAQLLWNKHESKYGGQYIVRYAEKISFPIHFDFFIFVKIIKLPF
jgi:hypothetical protein